MHGFEQLLLDQDQTWSLSHVAGSPLQGHPYRGTARLASSRTQIPSCVLSNFYRYWEVKLNLNVCLYPTIYCASVVTPLKHEAMVAYQQEARHTKGKGQEDRCGVRKWYHYCAGRRSPSTQDLDGDLAVITVSACYKFEAANICR